MKRCKCGMMIDFVIMDSGKKMPVEIEKPLRVVVIAQESVIPGDEVYKITSGLIPHWINCPYSKQFKKK
jgi:hypothetical protein